VHIQKDDVGLPLLCGGHPFQRVRKFSRDFDAPDQAQLIFQVLKGQRFIVDQNRFHGAPLPLDGGNRLYPVYIIMKIYTKS